MSTSVRGVQNSTDAEAKLAELIDIKADSIEDVALGDIFIAGIPFGKLLENAIENSKEAKEKAEQIEETTQTDDESSDEEATTLHRPQTRLERVLSDGVDCGERITKSVERSISIAGNFKEWAEKAPAGYVIRGGLRKLLSTAAGESLAWKQVHRAGEKLHELTDGAIEWRKTENNGWILVLRDESYLDRLSNVVSDKRGG